MLTQEQLNHYQTFGFIILRNLFSRDEVAILQTEFDRAAERAAKFIPFDGTQRQSVYFNGQDGPFFVSLTEDPRFVDVARQIYGEDVFAIGPASCTRFINPGTKWHPDTINYHQSGLGFVFFLQAVRADHGALRVLPGSHRNPWHDELREIRAKQKLGGAHPIRKALGGIENVPAYPCEADPCDVVAFDVRLCGMRVGAASRTAGSAGCRTTTAPKRRRKWKPHAGNSFTTNRMTIPARPGMIRPCFRRVGIRIPRAARSGGNG